MERDIVARMLDMYGVEYRAILPPQKGYRNSSYPVITTNGTLNLILYKSEPGMLARIKNVNALGDFLKGRGVPARHAHTHRVIRAMTEGGVQKHAALYTYLPGQTIPWEAYTMAHIKALGKAMAKLHLALKDYPPQNLPDIAEECVQLNHRMRRYFAGEHVRQAMQQKLGVHVSRTNFTKLFEVYQKLPNQQALHMDFVRGNILFDDEANITGILDFEKAGRGHPIFDIARTLAFLLVDCKYKPEEKVRKYFLRSGYLKIQPHATHAETLVPFFLLHDFYKFLRHNPYEHLPQNEHFVRTKAMLLKHGIIKHAHVT